LQWGQWGYGAIGVHRDIRRGYGLQDAALRIESPSYTAPLQWFARQIEASAPANRDGVK